MRERHLAGDADTVSEIRFVVALVAVLALYNNVANTVPAFKRRYVLVNLAATVALLLWGRREGLDGEALGLDPADAAAGARWGAVALVAVAIALGAGLATPAVRPLLDDGRLAELGGADMAFLALVRVPLGTVMLEEVASRGVLHGALQERRGRAAAVGVSSAVFGLWHVTPTLQALEANGLATTPVGRIAAVAAGVGVTALAGVAFSLLRIRSGSVVAPMLAHFATNSGGVAAAYLSRRIPRPASR